MATQPRVLLCCFDVVPAPTGGSRRVTEYLRTIGSRFDVDVLSIKAGDGPHIERYMGARLMRVPLSTGGLPGHVQAFDRAVRRQLESEEYALVHFFDPFGGFALCELAENYGHRLLYDATTFPSVELTFVESVAGNQAFLDATAQQELVCLMNSEAIITGSAVTRDFIISRGTDASIVHVLRSPVDRAPYTVEFMGIPDASPMKIVYVGNGRGHQGLSTVLKALQMALRLVDVRLSLVGPVAPDVRAAIEAQVQDLKLAGKVEVLPPAKHDDLFKVLATSDVGVIPLDDVMRNRRQGEPLTRLSEYLAAGRPVIATDLPVTRELIPPEVGLFYPAGDAKALASHWINLSADVAGRVARGAKARNASALVDTAAIGHKLLGLYASLGLSSDPADLTVPRPFEPTGRRRRPVRPNENRITAGAFLSNSVEPETRTDLIAIPASDTHSVITEPKPSAPLAEAKPSTPTTAEIRVAEPAADDEPHEISADEFEDISEETPVPAAPRRTDEIPAQAIPSHRTDEIPAVVGSSPALIGPDNWIHMVLHGYCPPETTTFNRPPPPTNFPGRDEPPR